MSSYKITQQIFATVQGKRREILRTVRCDDWPCCKPFIGEPAPIPSVPITLNSWTDEFNAVWLDENNNQWEA